MDWKKRIANYVKDAEEYPTMEELIEYFELYDLSLSDLASFIIALIAINNAEIYYDSKHSSWIYTGGPIKGEFVKIS